MNILIFVTVKAAYGRVQIYNIKIIVSCPEMDSTCQFKFNLCKVNNHYIFSTD